MSKVITIKLTKASVTSGPFTITDQGGNIIASSVPLDTLIDGESYIVEDSVTSVTLSSENCFSSKSKNLGEPIDGASFPSFSYSDSTTACLWRHLEDISLYNSFYGNTHPYIIEYPFSYPYQDEIIQNITDHSKVYKYIPDGTGVYSYNDKIELDNAYFNKGVVYNGQQSSGILTLVPKPKNSLKASSQYPIYSATMKTILYTKSDGFYKINTFWDIVKDKTKQLFNTSCESLSLDKEVNQDNMDYTSRSFKKSPLRGKDAKIRYILDDRDDIHIVSKMLINSTQISHK